MHTGDRGRAPRIRGDEPDEMVPSESLPVVLPASAGMSPQIMGDKIAAICAPRIRGDEPHGCEY